MLALDRTELDIVWKALGIYHDSISPDRDAWRWKILQLRTTVHEEQVNIDREVRNG